MKEFSEMTKKEKKDFLSNDLVERLIRLEQRVSASFGQFVPYPETEYFKSMSEQEKKQFVKYLKKNKKKKYLFGSFFFFLLAGAIFFNGTFTANVVKNTFNVSNIIISNIFLVLFFAFLLGIVIYRFFPKMRKKRIDGYFGILDKLYLKKINF